MNQNKKYNNSLLEAIRKECLEGRLDYHDLLSLGLELQQKRVDEQSERVRQICERIEKELKPADPLEELLKQSGIKIIQNG